MSKAYDELLKDYFKENVKFSTTQTGHIMAKWENTTHPDTPLYSQPVFWVAFCTGEGKLSVGYKISQQTPPKWVIHKIINPKQFRTAIFEIWKKQ